MTNTESPVRLHNYFPLPFSLPIPENAQQAAEIISRAFSIDDPDETFFMAFLDAIVECSDNPSIDELYRILSTNEILRRRILLSIDCCPDHDQDLDSCYDDFPEEYCQYAEEHFNS